jgi:hypothetical protein
VSLFLLLGDSLFSSATWKPQVHVLGCCGHQALFESRPNFLFHLLCQGHTCSSGVHCGLLSSFSFRLMIAPIARVSFCSCCLPGSLKREEGQLSVETVLIVSEAAPLVCIPCDLLLASAWPLYVLLLDCFILGPAAVSRGCINSPRFTVSHRDTTGVRKPSDDQK